MVILAKSAHITKPARNQNRCQNSAKQNHVPKPSGRSYNVGRTAVQRLPSIRLDSVQRWGVYTRWYTGDYHIPNDEITLRRSALQHLIWKHVLDGKHAACISESTDGQFRDWAVSQDASLVVNFGFGNGEWAFDVARTNPCLGITGIDIHIPADMFPPPNVICRTISPGDLFHPIDEMISNGAKCSMIQARSFIQTARDVKKFLGGCLARLRPGGYLELHELGNLASDVRRLAGTALADVQKTGDDALICSLGTLLRDVGFIDVEEARFRCPVNPETSGNSGTWTSKERVIASLVKRQYEETGLLQERYRHDERSLRRAKTELQDPDLMAYYPAYIVHGRRPFIPPLEHLQEPGHG